MSATAVSKWTGQAGAYVVDPLPDDWQEANEVAQQRAGTSGNGDEFTISPRVVCRAYTALYELFTDKKDRDNLANMSVVNLVRLWLEV